MSAAVASYAQGRDNAQPLTGVQEPLPASGSPWELHLGPVTLRSGGENNFELRPQMKFGGQMGHIQAEAGFSDVRDGLKFDMGCKASAEAKSSGHSLAELHENIRQEIGKNAAEAGSEAASAIQSTLQWFGLSSTSYAERLGASGSQRAEAMWAGSIDALESAQRMLSTSASEAGSRIGSIAQSLGLDVTDLDAVLSGADGAAEAKEAVEPEAAQKAEPMSLRLVASAGLAVGAQMCLGWEDTQGYRMVGVGGNASAIISLGGEVFAGWHVSGVGMRLVLGIAHFTFEYHFPRAVRPERFGPGQSGSSAAPAASGARRSAIGAAPAVSGAGQSESNAPPAASEAPAQAPANSQK